jgi:hypothetical protein
VLDAAPRVRSRGENPTPELVQLQVRMDDERCRRILDAAAGDRKAGEAIRKVVERALKKAQRAQSPRVVVEQRIVERKVEVPRDVHPRSVPVRERLHYGVLTVGILFVGTVVAALAWLGFEGAAARMPGCLTSSLGCGLPQAVATFADLGAVVGLGVAIFLLVEWIAYRDWVEDERRRNLGYREHRRSGLWYKGNVKVVDGKNFWEVRRRDEAAEVSTFPPDT